MVLKYQNDKFNDMLSDKHNINSDLTQPFKVTKEHGNILKINYSQKNKFRTLDDGTQILDNRVIDDQVHQVFLDNANLDYEKEKRKLSSLEEAQAWTWFEKKNKHRQSM